MRLERNCSGVRRRTACVVRRRAFAYRARRQHEQRSVLHCTCLPSDPLCYSAANGEQCGDVRLRGRHVGDANSDRCSRRGRACSPIAAPLFGREWGAGVAVRCVAARRQREQQFVFTHVRACRSPPLCYSAANGAQCGDVRSHIGTYTVRTTIGMAPCVRAAGHRFTSRRRVAAARLRADPTARYAACANRPGVIPNWRTNARVRWL